ncbi:MAG: fumarylacetoacetate hydrolase family protein [Betaproteobacteria bacterium]|nr:fumarylacetoacetate hydrolase family protein [Betaproteobacteria bacterium]
MPHYLRIQKPDQSVAHGLLQGDQVALLRGDLFADPQPTGETVALAEVTLLTPCVPTKMVALWNNFHALAAKLGQAIPPEPLYFLKGNSSFHPHGAPIRVPPSYAGKVVYEGELGVVIGRRAQRVTESEAAGCIFGYTCINDVTAAELLFKDASFPQWTRAKSFDTFGVFGPVIATGLDPSTLTVRTVLNGQERQNYAVSDMVFSPVQLVSRISQDLTLEPGDVIACGTSIGVGSMKAGSEVSVIIERIGTLTNRYE